MRLLELVTPCPPDILLSSWGENMRFFILHCDRYEFHLYGEVRCLGWIECADQRIGVIVRYSRTKKFLFFRALFDTDIWVVFPSNAGRQLLYFQISIISWVFENYAPIVDTIMPSSLTQSFASVRFASPCNSAVQMMSIRLCAFTSPINIRLLWFD